MHLEHDVLGPASGDPLVIVQGLGDQLTKWADGFPRALIERGFRVVRFDNRDAGLSARAEAEYALEDLAADTVTVLDRVGVERAHLVGASMGGMVAQLVAARHPDRVSSLTSIMSSTGNPELSPPGEAALAALLATAPDPAADEAAYLAHTLGVARVLGSPGYPDDDRSLRANLLAAVRRAHHPAGTARQLAAVLSDGDRRARLAGVITPTLVVHGLDDPLFAVDHAHDTVAAIRGARLLTLPGVGHHLPAALYGTVADAVAELRTGAPRR
ncbi:alpha/beta hydrolase [Amycolatopsis rhabdoformis]|uniref:Alpha/beta hydrolase n=1 Tax=Amycolatopsis rhabdoformis TaxID=1448059 RepID=A0ABZ1ICY6_9PSEU|nr:alpha/beta hydrolase [Amycolatopsis rhabdoformis]WSE31285.1 alpha/beta hydrolase [Amycolatopsis rhabdoformis]